MQPEDFFLGHLTGFGAVYGLTGKVQRRYRVELNGVLSVEHRAIHLDETYTYLDQPGEFVRRWVIHSDEQGYVLGHDAVQAARFRGQAAGEDFRAVFYRPTRPGGRMEPHQRVRFTSLGSDRVVMVGRTILFGLAIGATHTALRRAK